MNKKNPFFMRFVENQPKRVETDVKAGVESAGRRFQTMKYPSDVDEHVTMKYPSDDDENNPEW